MDWQKITEKMCDFIQEKVKTLKVKVLFWGLVAGLILL